MAAAKPSALRANPLIEITPELRRGLLAHFAYDGADIASVWTRYLSDRNPADLAALTDHYMPAAWFETRKMIYKADDSRESTGEHLSDAMLGLVREIQRTRSYEQGATYFRIRRRIRQTLWTEAKGRAWGGEPRTKHNRTLQVIRAELTRAHGRLPTREEIIVRLSQQFQNPNFYFAALDDRRMDCPSEADRDTGVLTTAAALREPIDTKEPPADQHALHAEVIRLAFKNLKGADRKILRLMLKGADTVAIAKKVGLNRSAVARRLNGILWEARTRADLAEYLGVEPDAAPPPKDAWNHYPTFKALPARRVG